MSILSSGSRVRQKREELGISRERLASRADVSTSTVARLELSDKLPNVPSLLRIAKTLGLQIEDIVSEREAIA